MIMKAMIGGGKVAKMMKKNIEHRLKKRQKKGQIKFTHQVNGMSDYYEVTGDDHYLQQTYDGVAKILSMVVDDNLISRAAAKVNRTLGDKHRDAVKMSMRSLFDIQIWMEDDDGNIIQCQD